MLADSEGLDQTANAQADLGLRCPHMHENTFWPILCTSKKVVKQCHRKSCLDAVFLKFWIRVYSFRYQNK